MKEVETIIGNYMYLILNNNLTLYIYIIMRFRAEEPT